MFSFINCTSTCNFKCLSLHTSLKVSIKKKKKKGRKGCGKNQPAKKDRRILKVIIASFVSRLMELYPNETILLLAHVDPTFALVNKAP